jgi:hypothetical protein
MWDDQWYPIAMPGNKMDRAKKGSRAKNELIIGMIKVESRFEEKSNEHELSIVGGKETNDYNKDLDFLMGELDSTRKAASPDIEVLN